MASNEKKESSKKTTSTKTSKTAVTKKTVTKKAVAKTQSKKPVDKILVGIGVAVALTLLGMAFSVSMVLSQSNEVENINVEVSVDDDAIMGSADAPITIVEFSDYTCPFCARHFSETLPQIKSEYIDKGLVKLVFRDFAFKGERSTNLAAAAECAGEVSSEAFYVLHDYIFSNNSASLEDVVAYGEAQGYGSEFVSCVNNGDMIDEVKKDLADAQTYGVNSTPTFFINGNKIVGAQPFSVFKEVIEDQLAELNAGE